MIIYGMHNKEQYLENLREIKDKLKKMVLQLDKYNGAMGLQDQIEYVLENIDNDYENDVHGSPKRYIKILNGSIRLNFITYYYEYEDYYNNEVIISEDWNTITFLYEYENLTFAQTYTLNDNIVKVEQYIPKENSTHKKYYSLELIKKGN